MYGVKPKMDVAADCLNTKCEMFITRKENALLRRWYWDSWCNPPHSKTEDFVRKALGEWMEFNNNIIMIIPTNTMSSNFWHECIENIAEYHAVRGRPRFLKNGRPAKFNSRNAYVCVIWRKKGV